MKDREGWVCSMANAIAKCSDAFKEYAENMRGRDVSDKEMQSLFEIACKLTDMAESLNS